jgi:hypothetical protein
MVCEAVAVFPQTSAAVQVRVTVYEPAHCPLVVTSAKVSVTVPPQASVAVAVANCGAAGQEMVDGAGKAAITGAVVSVTVMVCEAVDVFPQASVAVQVLVTEYELAQAPGVVTSTKVSVTVEQASVAVACTKVGETDLAMVSQDKVTGAGSGSITGGVVSITLMVCEAVEVFPQASVAVHVRVTE